MSIAKQAWNELYRLRLDPMSWTKKTPKAGTYLAYILKRNFDEFRFGDGDWKVERFAVVKYPDWCRDARDSGHLTRASQFSSSCFLLTTFPSLGARPSKRKMGDSRSLKDGRRQKKLKAGPTMPTSAQVIDLADNTQAPPSTCRTTTTLVPTPIITMVDPSASLPAPSTSSSGQELSTSTSVLVTMTQVSAAPSHTSHIATPVIPIHLPSCSDIVPSAAAVLSTNPSGI